MLQNQPPFEITSQAEQAAQLQAVGQLTDEGIADKVGVSRMTLHRWRQRPEFVARVKDHLGAFRDEVRRRGIAVRERRVKALNDRWNRLQAIVEARADDPTLKDAPGGTTGLLVRQLKGLGSGDNFREVEEFVLDASLLRELREIEKQAAQDLGQWTEKTEHSGDLTVRVEYADADTDADATEAPPGPTPTP